MDRIPRTVKSRNYDSSRRRQQAEASREAVLSAARDRFLADGVGTTTIASIAADAGVSVDTIYKTFGGKAGLIRAIVERALEGAGPVPAERRSDALQHSEPDPRNIMRGFGALVTEVAPRGSPVVLMVREAAGVDPAMRELWDELEMQRLRRMTANARNLVERGFLRAGMSAKEAGEIMWAYTSPELYERLVLKRHWSLQRYGAFIAEGLIAALLPD